MNFRIMRIQGRTPREGERLLKALLIALSALLLCARPALAETRERTVYLEGEPEIVVETLYQSPAGFSFWYDAGRLSVEASEDGESLTVRPVEWEMPFGLTLRAAGTASPWDFLDANAPADITYSLDETEDGGEIVWFENVEGSWLRGCYAVTSGGNLVTAEAGYPLEAAEGFGVRFSYLIRSIAIDRAAPEGRPLLIDYFQQTVGTPEEQPYCEIALYGDDGGQVLLVVYEGGTGPETSESFLVPMEAFEKAMKVVEAHGMAGWNDLPDAVSLEGKRYVCRFEADGAARRVTSEHMPEGGERAFSELYETLRGYIGGAE